MKLRTVLALAAALLFYIGCGDDGIHYQDSDSIVYSPDSKTLAAVGKSFMGDTILLLDAETGAVKASLEAHDEPVRSAAFSPDGKTLVSGGGWMDHSIRVWDIETGALLKSMDVGFGSHAVTFSPDGKTLASGGHMGKIRFWNVGTWTQTAIQSLKGDISCLAYSPDGERLAAGAALSPLVHIFDGRTAEPVQTLRGHRDTIISAAYSPDGKILASGGSEGQITLWNAYTGKRLQKLKGHESGVSSLSFSPDSTTLVRGGYGKTMQLWDVQTGKLIKTIQDADGSGSIAYSPNGTTIVSGSLNIGVRSWNVETGELMKTQEDYRRAVRFLAFSPDGEIIFAGDARGQIGMLDVKTLKTMNRLREHRYWSNGTAALSPDGKTLAAAHTSGFSDLMFWPTAAHHWDDEKRKTGREAAQKEFLARAEHLELSGGGSVSSRNAAADLKNAVRSSQYAYDVDINFSGNIHCMAYSPDGKTLAAGGGLRSRGRIVLINAETAHVKAVIKDRKHRARFAAFSPDGKTLASGSLDRTVRFWDAETGAAVRDLKGHKGMAYAGAYSPDGKTLAVASSKTVAVWDAKTDAPLHTLEGHDGAAFCLAFSPDGAEIATGGRDKTVRRWNAQTGEMIKTLEKHAAPVTAVAYSPDGSDILSGDANGKILRWNLND